ncbi:DUF1496 domain-containing protein [Aeromonas jandaei]|uniref:DUF1496 domain-containing protein n=1 Tax=Aeromonas jandaei TaxID=650 RepID=UPI001C5AA211|nr:DUF1496 domain-containing protein [Aeromonas jandaei]MBW3806739.1 DUF1496 domain-containing protein [Aeromonas jandaei]
MKNRVLWLLASCWLLPVHAATDTRVAGEGSSTQLVLPLGSLPERVCWFQDQKFSQGARILQGDIWLECGPQNDLESNGPLVWRSAATVLPATRDDRQQKTISVGQ